MGKGTSRSHTHNPSNSTCPHRAPLPPCDPAHGAPPTVPSHLLPNPHSGPQTPCGGPAACPARWGPRLSVLLWLMERQCPWRGRINSWGPGTTHFLHVPEGPAALARRLEQTAAPEANRCPSLSPSRQVLCLLSVGKNLPGQLCSRGRDPGRGGLAGAAPPLAGRAVPITEPAVTLGTATPGGPAQRSGSQAGGGGGCWPSDGSH